MTTPLIEACARALFEAKQNNFSRPFCSYDTVPERFKEDTWRPLARAVIPLVIDAAAEVANGFDWEVYGDRIADAILALKPEAQS